MLPLSSSGGGEVKRKKSWLISCFFLHFIPLDPDTDPQTQLNADPIGSGSASLDNFQIKKICRKKRGKRKNKLQKKNCVKPLKIVLDNISHIKLRERER